MFGIDIDVDIDISSMCLLSLEAIRRIGSPKIGVTDSCEPLCGCWELNPNPLQEQLVLLTTETP